MKKLIYLEDALNIAMQYCPDDDGSCSKSGVDIREMLDELESLPFAHLEADLVAVVRCKDCKYNSSSPDYGNACCDMFYGMADQMGFCHYGERRTDE